MKKVKLNEIATVFSGLSYKRYLDDDGDKFNIIVQRSIKKDGECGDFEETFLNKKFKKRYFSQKNDILMKIYYPFDVICIKQENLIISDRIAIIRLKKGHDPNFIAHLLSNSHIKNNLIIKNNEKVVHTSLKQIKQLELIIPDLDTQIKYGELLNAINEKIFHDLKQVEYDRNLKEAIINELWDEYERI